MLAWHWWYIGPVAVGNVGDNSVGNYRLHTNFLILHLLTILKQALVCSLNFECPRPGYGFLSIIFVLEKCNLGPWNPWKVLEFCTLSLLRTPDFTLAGLWQCFKNSWVLFTIKFPVDVQLICVARMCCKLARHWLTAAPHQHNFRFKFTRQSW